MTVRVKFFAFFRQLFGVDEMEVDLGQSADVRTLLEKLCDSPLRREQIFDGAALKSQVVVMKNGTSVLSLERLGTPLQQGDTVAVFPFLGGG